MVSAEIVKDVSSGFTHGRKSSIGTGAAVQLTATSFPCQRGVLVKAGKNNTGDIWLGGAGVTADAADGTSGVPITPGESLTVPVNDPTAIYAIADSGASNKVYFWAA